MIATVRPFELALESPFETAKGTIDARNGFLFDVFDDPKGLGEACPLHPFTEARPDSHDVLQQAADDYTETGWLAAFRRVSETGDGQLRYPAARHAVSLAYLDKRAREAHEPLYRHLGNGDGAGSVELSATIGDHPTEETAEQAEAAVAAGYPAVTVKVGNRSVAEDAERVRAARSAIGPEVDLRLDANGAWAFDQARSFIESTSELDLAYIEQPLEPGDLEGHNDLRGRGVAIGLDESVALHGIEAVRAADAADVFVLKPMAMGGVDVARGAAVDLLRRGSEVVFSTTVDSVVARTAAVHAAASLPDVPPSPLATGGFFEADLAPSPAQVEDGIVTLADDPGLGIDEIDV